MISFHLKRQLMSVTEPRLTTCTNGRRKYMARKNTWYVVMMYCYLEVNHGQSKSQIVKCRSIKKVNYQCRAISFIIGT